MTDPKVGEGTQNAGETKPAEEAAKHPETVEYSKYIGVKEMLTKQENTNKELNTKVSTLEEQVKNAGNPEALKKAEEALTKAQEEAKTANEELTKLKESTTAEKRANLVKRGVSEEKVKDMSAKELDTVLEALGAAKPPKPDLGGGGSGGAGERMGSPMERARQAYTK